MAAGAATVLTVGLGAGPALAAPSAHAGRAAAAADPTISVTYPVTGSTHLQRLGTVSLGSGSLAVTLDLTTSATSATLSLPPATASATVLGLRVTATTAFIQDGPATGTADLATNAVTTTAKDTLQITSLNLGGKPFPVGPRCETAVPASITVTSQPGFNLLAGGNLAGTYKIPPFAHCGLATVLLDLALQGRGNTITLTLGAASLG